MHYETKRGSRSLSRGAIAPLAAVRLGWALALYAVILNPAHANLVKYDWVQGAGPGGSGSMTFNIGSSTNGSAFSAGTAALQAFSFTFSNGDMISLSGLNSINVNAGWSAAGGYLTTVAQLSKTGLPLPTYTFQYAAYSLSSPNPNGSTAVDLGSTGTLQNFGVWKESAAGVSTVPLPSTAGLFGLGLAGVLWLGQRRRQRP
ncbi:MAG: PEP-CTERM sorting domain-containing protein [Burkholderiales bacterium]|nr:PEP-CTERM sorting domain-containing protein [Burkholderiales bacterium]